MYVTIQINTIYFPVVIPCSYQFSALLNKALMHTLGTIFCIYAFSSIQSLNRVWLFVTPWITACQASLSITNSWSLPKLKYIELVRPSSHLIFCHPLLFLPQIPPSIRVFLKWVNPSHEVEKYWEFQLSISPSNEHLGLISLRMDWFNLLAVQGTLKSLLQHNSSKASILRCSPFFTVQL